MCLRHFHFTIYCLCLITPKYAFKCKRLRERPTPIVGLGMTLVESSFQRCHMVQKHGICSENIKSWVRIQPLIGSLLSHLKRMVIEKNFLNYIQTLLIVPMLMNSVILYLLNFININEINIFNKWMITLLINDENRRKRIRPPNMLN